MQQPVGLGDVEQPVEYVFQDAAIGLPVPQSRGDLAGIGFEAGDVRRCEVIEPRDVARSRGGTEKICWKALTSSWVTTPSAFAILAESAIIATEKATRRRRSGSLRTPCACPNDVGGAGRRGGRTRWTNSAMLLQIDMAAS